MTEFAPFRLIERDSQGRVTNVTPVAFAAIKSFTPCESCGRRLPKRRRNPKTQLCSSCWANVARAIRLERMAA